MPIVEYGFSFTKVKIMYSKLISFHLSWCFMWFIYALEGYKGQCNFFEHKNLNSHFYCGCWWYLCCVISMFWCRQDVFVILEHVLSILVCLTRIFFPTLRWILFLYLTYLSFVFLYQFEGHNTCCWPFVSKFLYS